MRLFSVLFAFALFFTTVSAETTGWKEFGSMLELEDETFRLADLKVSNITFTPEDAFGAENGFTKVNASIRNRGADIESLTIEIAAWFGDELITAVSLRDSYVATDRVATIGGLTGVNPDVVENADKFAIRITLGR